MDSFTELIAAKLNVENHDYFRLCQIKIKVLPVVKTANVA